MKYNYMWIGSGRWIVNFHDGVKTHPDGSDFYDVAIFRNKRKMSAFIKELTSKGYKEAQ